MEPQSEKIDLSDIRLFGRGAPHEIFRRLRRDDPVYWNETPDGSGFWALTRHADVLAVSTDSEAFSSERHGIMMYDESFETSGRERTMLEMDAPRHTRLRALVSRGMTPRRILELEDFARRTFAEILERALEKRSCDFVTDVASQLPLQIISEMMGIPAGDRPQLGQLAHRVQGFDDPELGGGDGASENSDAILEMSSYAFDLARERRRRPQADIATKILQAEIEGYAMDDAAFAAFFLLLITAGIETTKSAISGGMLALVEHPEQWSYVPSRPTFGSTQHYDAIANFNASELVVIGGDAAVVAAINWTVVDKTLFWPTAALHAAPYLVIQHWWWISARHTAKARQTICAPTCTQTAKCGHGFSPQKSRTLSLLCVRTPASATPR